ncbi:MAG TPA: HAD-IA family hydrolase [Candidatus Eisenbacteria bacterium]|nr:HAD-IA family hydrolase [Candidatus Eisenbacteria bacterium]
MSIKAVFFDAAGTLIKPARPVGEIYASLAARYGIQASASELSKRFRLCFASAPPLAFPGARPEEIKACEREWWKRLLRSVFQPWGSFERFEACFDELFSHFAKAESWRIYPETEATLAGLAQRGLKLAVVSNFDSRLLAVLDGLGIGRCFGEVIVSSEIGHAKPEREIFHAALERYRLRPEDVLHVGDSETNDVQGATDAGLVAALVDRERSSENHTAAPFRIRDLRGVLSIIDRLARQSTP